MGENYDTSGHDWGAGSEYEISYFLLLFLCLLAVALLTAHAVAHSGRFQFLPEAGVIMLVGAAVSAGLQVKSDSVTDQLMGFSPTVFFVLLLPPIIFNSSYHLKRRLFIDHLGSISTFALGGTLVSAVFVGFVLWLLGEWGVSAELSLAECLAFGALISATDPVSTLAVFQELQVEPTLFYLVFGESVLNDAVGLVAFRSFAKFVGFSHTVSTGLLAAADFVLVFVGSTVIGGLFGMAVALALKRLPIRQNTVLESTIYIMCVYVPFFLAEMVDMSGIVTILFVGIAMKRYAHNNISVDTKHTSDRLFRLMAHVAEAAVFLDLGLSVFAYRDYNFAFITWAVLACLLGRAVHVYPLTWLLNKRPNHPRIETNQTHMLWFSGLRGAVAYACAVTFPGENKDLIVTSTMVIVLLTVFLMGGATVPVLDALHIQRRVPAPPKLPDGAWERRAVVQWEGRVLKPFLCVAGTVSQWSTDTGEHRAASVDAVGADLNESLLLNGDDPAAAAEAPPPQTLSSALRDFDDQEEDLEDVLDFGGHLAHEPTHPVAVANRARTRSEDMSARRRARTGSNNIPVMRTQTALPNNRTSSVV